jgi:hypothetical protein
MVNLTSVAITVILFLFFLLSEFVIVLLRLFASHWWTGSKVSHSEVISQS